MHEMRSKNIPRRWRIRAANLGRFPINADGAYVELTDLGGESCQAKQRH